MSPKRQKKTKAGTAESSGKEKTKPPPAAILITHDHVRATHKHTHASMDAIGFMCFVTQCRAITDIHKLSTHKQHKHSWPGEGHRGPVMEGASRNLIKPPGFA